MALNMLPNVPVKYNGSPTDTHQHFGFSSDSFPRSFDLVSVNRVSKSNDALCLVKDVLSNQLITVLASQLRIYTNRGDAFLFALAGGQR